MGTNRGRIRYMAALMRCLGEVRARFGDEMGKVTCIPTNSAGMPRQPQFALRSSALVMFDLRDDRLSAQQTDRNSSSHSAV